MRRTFGYRSEHFDASPVFYVSTSALFHPEAGRNNGFCRFVIDGRRLMRADQVQHSWIDSGKILVSPHGRCRFCR